MKPILFLSLFMSAAGVWAKESVSNYAAFFGSGRTARDTSLILLRSFDFKEKKSFLAVNPRNFRTLVVPEESLLAKKELPFDSLRRRFKALPYFKAIAEAEAHDSGYQEAGITRLLPVQSGVFLTVDLCPSKKPMDTVVFTTLLDAFCEMGKPVPLSIAITGRWMDGHRKEFDWIAGLAKSGAISVIWINHSFTHRTNKKHPERGSFLLEKGVDLNFEVLETEKRLIGEDFLPSVFFRFPGLVSNDALYRKIIAFGLIPVGTDTWLAKKQWPKEGSIVLVHGNGNEPYGIKRFLKLIREEGEKIRSKQWLLYDLQEGMAEEEGAGTDSSGR